MKKNYKKKYRILVKGVTEVIKNLKYNINNEKLPLSTMRYMSDLKYYILKSFYCDRDIKKLYYNKNNKLIKITISKKRNV